MTPPKRKRRRPLRPITPISRIKSALRRVWLYSRERRAALKHAGNSCECCGEKEHIEVHHIEPVSLDDLCHLVQRRLLPPHDRLQVLCRDCHKDMHGED